ncbi:TetR/AcrR family transcriptional regulator [Frankia sp. AgB1.9]|uniref:TetR/AcrR family transcriptional regulator n=1 Tax=unclassified Frankia TaxID=2632575 RepID=UPI001931CAAF|nr:MULTISPECIES: TetR/AcrR family transcriptional regulator [unclassified Frankia]MBL7489431.1 TetR/AcrR family transcriptional regulator [Frankia sp. AgW1.1]MBL7550634.1 TetR/AcrR family transcriptional regulator [Frankia sp. AgB1.9]MBL7620991.1 TetR/AcrR family transcriptional regulator [Frankia sp. AgB1.8]
MASPRRPRGPYRKSAERREQILQAAYEAIDEHGERASLQDIADRVGVTQPALTYYFPTRDDLLLAVLQRRDVLGRMLADVAEDGQKTIDGLVASTRLTTDHPGLAKLYVTLSAAATDPDSPARSYFTERYRRYAAEITEDLQNGQRTGVIRADEPAGHLARAMLAVLDGLQIQWMYDPTVDIAAITEAFTRLLAGAGQATPTDPTDPGVGPNSFE